MLNVGQLVTFTYIAWQVAPIVHILKIGGSLMSSGLRIDLAERHPSTSPGSG